MKYDNLRAFEKHLESAFPQHFASLYLLLCKDDAEAKEALDLCLRHLLPNNRDLSLFSFEASNLSYGDLLTELHSNSFFSDKRVLLIQQAEKLKKDVQESLGEYFGNIKPNAPVHLLLTSTSLAKSTTFYKQIEKAGIVLDIPEAKSWEKEKRLVDWVSKQAAGQRKIMSHQACQFLVKQIGCDQATLIKEFEKLLCYVGERPEIGIQDVSAICSVLNMETVWQLGEAIFNFNTPNALHIVHDLIIDGNALLPLLRQIRSQFQTGYQIATIMAKGGQPSDIVKEYPYMKGGILDRNIHTSQHYGMERYKKGLLALDDAEMQTKNSVMEESLLAELLIIKLCTR